MTTSTYQNSELSDLEVPWQTPVITEKLASEQLIDSHPDSYLNVPWATLIDWYNHGNKKNKTTAERAFTRLGKLPTKERFTVCQHYKFQFILPLLKRIGCTQLFTPHSTETQQDGIETHAFPLFAPVVPEFVEHRELWYSFVGAYMSHYISNIRAKIFSDNHPDNAVVVPRGKWQFNLEVYNEQVTGKTTAAFESYQADQNKQYYKRVLQQSRYSLCPSGAGPSSIRIYESLACGAIPIILADTFRFPRVKGVDWNECCVNIKESNYQDMRRILKSIPLARENEMRHNCIQAYTQVSGENFVKCIKDYYE